MADLPDETAAFINGLRALADFYEADPTFPLPYAVAIPNQECRESFMVHGVDSVEDAVDLTSRLGVDGTRDNHCDTVAYHDFGLVRVGLYIPEDIESEVTS